MTDYFSLKTTEVKSLLQTSEQGLSQSESETRLQKYGLNELDKKEGTPAIKILLRQFTSPLVLILLGAILVSVVIGETTDAIVIAIIVLINGVFGFVQEYRAEKAIEALQDMVALKARVIRDCIEKEVDSKELVPGDIIIIDSGSKIPADSRLIKVASLQLDEASLTGESVPSTKNISPLAKGTAVTDQENMVFMGTAVTKGRGTAVVTATGMNTQIGKIASMVQTSSSELTPLQHKLKQLGKWLGIVTILVCIVVFLLGIFSGFIATGVIEGASISEMFLVAVALAVAAIPEGLPAIVTVSLALGVKRMVKRNALVRELPAVETLGSTNVICTDKTGTLTKNEMTVKQIFANNAVINVTGEGYTPEGFFVHNDGSSASTKYLGLLLRAGALCNDSSLRKDSKWTVTGDPTEAALLVSAHKAGFYKTSLEKIAPRVDEIPFDSERKTMTTINKVNGQDIAFVKGAPDIILDKCSYIYINGKVSRLTKEDRSRILGANKDMASGALRVLGFAYRPMIGKYDVIPERVERNLTFIGLQAMIDPPRSEVKDSINTCKSAGIRTVMITGDHKLTAIAIAKELGILNDQEKALSGDELNRLNDQELESMVDNISVYARVNPEHKARILAALKNKGHIVAMTGDGVNDAPALKGADIGIAMGITGTDVAKESSDMILTDDNFSSIVNAVEEGRGIYNSIKQFVQYTLSSNLGEILVIFIALLLGWPVPLIAIQILWVNLLTDGLPGLALGLDPFSKDIMGQKPRKKNEPIISKEVIWNIMIVGSVMSMGTLSMYFAYGIGTDKARSVAFTTLILFQMFNVLTYRAKNFLIEIKSSMFLIGSVIISVLMQFIVLYTPLSTAFKTVPLGLMDWVYIVLVSATLYVILEIRKMIISSRSSTQKNPSLQPA